MFSIVNRKFIAFLIITGLLATSAFFFFPAATEADLEFSLALAFAVSLTQLGAIWYFLTSLKTFKKGLRIAYYFLSLGIFFFSLIQIELVASMFIVFIENVIVDNLLIIVPYILSSFFMYMGMRKFAHLLGVHNLWTKLFVSMGLSLLAAAVFILLPHPPIEVDEKTLDLIMASVFWCGAFSAAATLIAWSVRQAIGDIYKAAITWTSASLAVLSFTALQEVITKIYFANTAYVVNGFSVWPFALLGVLLLRAGLAFKETSRQFVVLPANATYVDIVTGVTQFVSNHAAVDDKLDSIRLITAKSGKENLSPADKATLLQVYLYVENYLTTEEPLQKFTREGLRNGLPDDFVRALPPLAAKTAPKRPQQPPAPKQPPEPAAISK